MLPPPAHVVVIHDDGGGIVDAFARRVARYGRRVRRVEIRGECASACTMVLAVSDRICVGPRASFGFHQAYTPTRRDRWATWNRSDLGTAELMAHYPPAIVRWIEARGGLGPDLIWLRGAELEAIVPACQRARHAEVRDAH